MSIIINMMSNERIGVRINPPNPICTETPVAREARRHGRRPSTAEVRTSVVAQFRREWPQITREIRSVQGPGKYSKVKFD